MDPWISCISSAGRVYVSQPRHAQLLESHSNHMDKIYDALSDLYAHASCEGANMEALGLLGHVCMDLNLPRLHME